MKKLLFFILILFCSQLAKAQFTETISKFLLNYQTDSKGLEHYGNGVPTYTPENRFDTYQYRDTVTNTVYFWNDTTDEWQTVYAFADSAPSNVVGPPAVNYQKGIWYNTSNDSLYAYFGVAWDKIGAGLGADQDSITTVTYSVESDTLTITLQSGATKKVYIPTDAPKTDNANRANISQSYEQASREYYNRNLGFRDHLKGVFGSNLIAWFSNLDGINTTVFQNENSILESDTLIVNSWSDISNGYKLNATPVASATNTLTETQQTPFYNEPYRGYFNGDISMTTDSLTVVAIFKPQKASVSNGTGIFSLYSATSDVSANGLALHWNTDKELEFNIEGTSVTTNEKLVFDPWFSDYNDNPIVAIAQVTSSEQKISFNFGQDSVLANTISAFSPSKALINARFTASAIDDTKSNAVTRFLDFIVLDRPITEDEKTLLSGYVEQVHGGLNPVAWLPDTTLYKVEITGQGGDAANGLLTAHSIRENSIVWHEGNKKWYMVADLVDTLDSNHPDSFGGGIWLFSSDDGEDWSLVDTVAVAFEDSTAAEGYGKYGLASPVGLIEHNGRLIVSYSSQDSLDVPLNAYTYRSISIAYSHPDSVEVLPWTKLGPIAKAADQPDDPALFRNPITGKVEVFFRGRTFNSYIPGSQAPIQAQDDYDIYYATADDPLVLDSWSKPVPLLRDSISTGEVAELTQVQITGPQNYNLFSMSAGGAGLSLWKSRGRKFKNGNPWRYEDYTIKFDSVNQEYPDTINTLTLINWGHPTLGIKNGKVEFALWTASQEGSRYGLYGLKTGFIETVDVDTITSPDEVSGLIAWYKSDVGLLDSLGGAVDIGEGVATWEDQSSSNWDLTGLTDSLPYRGTADLNGISGIVFDGGNEDHLDNTDYVNNQPATIIVVCKNDPSGNNIAIHSDTSNTNVHVIQFLSDNFNLYAGTTLGTSYTSTAANMVAGVANSTSSKLYVNGTLENTGDAGSNNHGGLRVGNHFNVATGAEFDGTIYEIFIYSRELNATEISDLYGYCSDRYGI
jgi:hypothetical protein